MAHIVHDTQLDTWIQFSDTPNLQLIEGVSNEVTVAFTIVAVPLLTIVYLWFKQKQQRPIWSIHPRIFSDGDRSCPICYGDANYPIATNCGHLSCCDCIMVYWRHSTSRRSAVLCAICKTTVKKMMPIDWPNYVEAANSASIFSLEGDDEDGRIQRKTLNENNIRINDYNRRFSGEMPLLEQICDVPVLLLYAFKDWTGRPGLGVLFRLRVFVCLITVTAYMLIEFLSPEYIVMVQLFLDQLNKLFGAVMLSSYFAAVFRQLLMHRPEAESHIFSLQIWFFGSVGALDCTLLVYCKHEIIKYRYFAEFGLV